MSRKPACWAAIALLGIEAAFCAGESAFWDLWKIHDRDPSRHEDLAARCRKFFEANPADPLRDAAKSLEAWHLLAAGREGEAWPIFEAQCALAGNGVQTGAARVARGWISRRDREKVAAALKQYYAGEIAFPAALSEIAAHPDIPAGSQPPANDAFGAPWSYRLTGFEGVPGFENQKYSLECAELGPLSGLRESLGIPYAGHIAIKPTAIKPGPGGVPVVTFQSPDSKGVSVVGEGQAAKGVHLAFAGRTLVLVCDATHWKALPAPK